MRTYRGTSLIRNLAGREFLAMAKDSGLIDINLTRASVLNIFVYVQNDDNALDSDVSCLPPAFTEGSNHLRPPIFSCTNEADDGGIRRDWPKPIYVFEQDARV